MDLQDWKEKGTTFNYKNKAVFNYIDGEGEPILFLHGDPGSGYEFKYLIPYLRDSYKLIIVDMLGFGYSDKPTRYDYALGDQAEMLQVLITLTGAEDYHLVCADKGAYVGLHLLEDNYRGRKMGSISNSLKSLFLINSSIHSGQYKSGTYEAMQRGPLGRVATLTMNKSKFKSRYLSRVVEPRKLDDKFLDDLWKLNEANEGYLVHHKLRRMTAQFRRESKSLRKSLKSASTPVHLLFGQEDNYLNSSAYIRFKNEVEEGSLTLVSGVGHYPHIESPEETATAIKEFISQPVLV